MLARRFPSLSSTSVLVRSIIYKNAVRWCFVLIAMNASPLMGEVTQSAPDGFQIKISMSTPLDPSRTYRAFVEDFSKWWDASHSYSGKAANLSLDLDRNCMLETLGDGGFVRHMEISYCEKDKAVRLLGGMGPLQEMGIHGAMTFSFEQMDEATVISLTYNVTGASFQKLDQVAEPVDGVLTQQMERLKKYCESLATQKTNQNEGGEVDRAAKSDAERAAEILASEIGTWDCEWSYLDADGKVVNTVTGVEEMRYAVDKKLIELTTEVPAGKVVSKSIRFYNPVTNKLTLLSVGADGNHWEMIQDVDRDVMVSKPHPNADGSQQFLRFTTVEKTDSMMRVLMESSSDNQTWTKVFYQKLTLRKK